MSCPKRKFPVEEKIELLKQVVLRQKNEKSEIELLCNIISKLRSDGVCVVKDLVQPEEAEGARRELQSMYNVNGNFTPGKLCNVNVSDVKASAVRGDEVKWLDGLPEQTPFLSRLKKKLNRLAVSLFSANSVPMHNVSRSKIMASCYNGCGTAYKRHIDSPCEGTLKLTFVFYLNKDLKQEDGGCLRIHSGLGHLDVKPDLGTLVIMRSDTVIHEVLPCYFQRFAFTIWYKEVAKLKATDVGLEESVASNVASASRSPQICMDRKKIKLEPRD